MPDTISSLPYKPPEEKIIAKQAGMTSWRSLGSCARYWFSSRWRKKGKWRAIPHAELQWRHGFPEQTAPFQRTPVDPEWLSAVGAAGSGSVLWVCMARFW